MTVSSTVARLFVENFASVQAIARRLRRSQDELRPLMPLDPARMEALSDIERTHLDAFIKRFENLQDILDSQVLRGLLLLEDVDLSGKTPRDVSNLLEKWGIIESAAGWRELRDLRNTLAHEYPREPGIQVERLNRAYGSVDALLGVLERVRTHAMTKGLADLSAHS